MTLQHGHVTVEHGHVTVEHGHVTVEHGHVTVEHGHVTVEHGHVTVEHGHVTVEHGHVTADVYIMAGSTCTYHIAHHGSRVPGLLVFCIVLDPPGDSVIDGLSIYLREKCPRHCVILGTTLR